MALPLKVVKTFQIAACFSRFQVVPAVWQRILHFSTSSEPLTQIQQKNGIRTITLNNPKKRNALSLAMLESLKASMEDGLENTDLRVIVINANGPVFSSGHDLKELTSETGTDYHKKVFQKCTEVMSFVQDIPVPVIAEVKGLATAAGCQLVASCDIAIAAEGAKFATPGVSVGLFCHTPGVAVARSVPNKVAMEMLFTGQPITAEDALRHGLVSRVVPEDQLEQVVEKVCGHICKTSRPVSAFGKALFYRQVHMQRDEAYRLAEQAMVQNLAMTDGKEGIDAFVGKRHPQWSHKDSHPVE